MATAEAVGALLSSLGATGSLLCLSSHKKEKRQGKILGAFCRKEAILLIKDSIYKYQ